MAYKWKPSQTARREFAQKMQTDSNFAAEYYLRKAKKVENKRASSNFDYETAGGYYIATKAQHDFATFDRTGVESPEQMEACNQVAYSFTCQEKIHHDYIHIVNELIRAKK